MVVSDHCDPECGADWYDQALRMAMFYLNSYFYILPAGLLDLYLIPVCFANYVELDKKKIFIRFGFSREEVLVEDITAMHRADRFTLSFCASADVVLLACRNKKNVVVSLKDNKAFMDELQKLNKKIKVYI